MRKLIISCVLVGLLASTAAAREWKDTAGKVQVVADFGGLSGGKVILILENGDKKTVSIEKLSQEDQAFVKSQPAAKLLGPKKVEPQGPPQADGDDRFSVAIRKDPKNHRAYVARGIANTNRGDQDAAIADFNYALQLEAKNPTAYAGRGRAYSKKGDAAQAYKDYSKAIEIDNKYAPAYKYRADNMPQYFKTPEGKAKLDKFTAKAREKRDHIDKIYRKRFPWQPPNSTTDVGASQAAIKNIANLDYMMYEQLEAKYGDRGYDGFGAYGGGGVGGNYGVGVVGGNVLVDGVVTGEVVKIDGVLSVYPKVVTQGDEVTIVANPALLAPGMPQMIDPNAPKPKRGQKPATIPQDVTSVDFYQDSNRDGKLQKDVDKYLTTDSTGQDGFSATIKTDGYLPGNQAYFAVPKGDGESTGGADLGALTLNENLLRALAKSERNVAAQAAAAAKGEGLSKSGSEALSTEQSDIARQVSAITGKIKKSAPEVAKQLAEARKPIGQTVSQLRTAKKNIGPASKVPASSAAQTAEMAADQLEAAANALAEITGSGGDKPKDGEGPDGQPSDGQPKPAKPPTDEKYAGNPGIGSGKIELAKAKPAPGPPGNGNGNGNNGGDDDDGTVVNNYFGDKLGVDLDDDDRRFGFGVTRDDVVDLADRYYRDGDYDSAIEKYDVLVRDQPYNVEYVNNRARTYYDAGNYDLALRDYQQVANVSKPGYDFYYNRGCAYLAAGKYKEAISDFTTSVELDELGKLGNLPYNNRGITYARMADYEQALSDFNKAIATNENDSLAYRNRALAYKMLGQIEKAKADLVTSQRIAAQ